MKTKKEKFMTMLVIVIAIFATVTIVIGDSHATKELEVLGSGSTLVPTGVDNSLNITFSDVTYSTVAPAFEFQRGNYNVNATWINPGKTETNVTNATYLVMQSTASTGLSKLSQVQYNLVNYNKNAHYFFMETKIAENYTGTTSGDVSLVLSDSGVSTYLSTANSVSAGTGTIVITLNNGVMTASANESSTSYTTGTSTIPTLSALQFYDISVYVYKDTNTTVNITIAVINPANGIVLGKDVMTNVAGVNFSKIDYVSYQFEGDSGSALILDWGYFVFSGYSSIVSPSFASSSVVPFVNGEMGNLVMNGEINSNIAPFDPSAVNNTQYKQAPNATYIHTNTVAGSGQFSNTSILSNQTPALQSEGAYNVTSLATFGVGNQTSANSTVMVANITLNPENTQSFTADIHVSVWNSTGIYNAVMDFLKNYTANLATVNTGIEYSYKNMTIISYMISNIQTITNLSASDASAVRDYFDNAFPAILKATNLSLIDTNTSAIVAGAFAGYFYYSGMAIVPEIHNNYITDPVTGKTYANLSDAGFAAGAYISGGAIIVPQLTLLGFSAGTPIFTSGFSLGNIFGGLTSAGSSVLQYLGNGVTDISNTIGSIGKTATSYVVKPFIATGRDITSSVSKDISTFRNDVSKLTSSIVPVLGTVTNNVQNDIHGAFGPISGAISDLSSSLASVKNGVVTAVAAGASGLKSDIYSLGTKISSTASGIINTLGAKIDSTDAVLSSMFTAMKSLPGQIDSGLASVASTLKTSILNSLDTVGNTIVTSVNGVKSIVTNAFGEVANKITGVLGFIKTGLGSIWSFITSFGAKLGYILEIVGITIAAIVIVGLILYFGVLRRSGSIIPGETKI